MRGALQEAEGFQNSLYSARALHGYESGGYDRSVRKITREKLKKSVEVGNILEAKACVCHPGYDKWRFDGNEQLWLDGSIETWTEVLGVAGKDLLVLVENIFEETPDTFKALFDYFKEKISGSVLIPVISIFFQRLP